MENRIRSSGDLQRRALGTLLGIFAILGEATACSSDPASEGQRDSGVDPGPGDANGSGGLRASSGGAASTGGRGGASGSGGRPHLDSGADGATLSTGGRVTGAATDAGLTDASDADQHSSDAAVALEGGCAATHSTVAGTYHLRLHSSYTRTDCQSGPCDEAVGTEDGDATLTLTTVYGAGFGLQLVGALDAPSIDLEVWNSLHTEQYGRTGPLEAHDGDPLSASAFGFQMTANGATSYVWDGAWKGQKIELEIWTPEPAEHVDCESGFCPNDEVRIDIDMSTGKVTSFARTSTWMGLGGDEATTSQTGMGWLECEGK